LAALPQGNFAARQQEGKEQHHCQCDLRKHKPPRAPQR
jgi:hypothetical protein